MTSQIPDRFLYIGEQYTLVALDGEGLIKPQDYGMKPKMLHTGCYRGFYSTYEVTNDGLFLTEMVIGKVEEGYQPIQAIMPKQPDSNSHSYFTYKGLKLFAPFTGTLKIAKDFIKELYIHMGYQKASAYETVLEFKFEKGKFVMMKDISSENATKRGNFKERFETGDIMQSIEESFSLDMNLE